MLSLKMKETPSSPLPSFRSLRIEKVEDVEDDNIINENDDNALYDFHHRDRRLERSRSMDGTLSGNDKEFFTSELEQENDRLREELLLLKTKYARVKSKLKEQMNHHHQYKASGSLQQHATPLTSLKGVFTTGGGGVLLEWPVGLRKIVQKNGISSILVEAHETPPGSTNAEEHHSVSTTDERSTVDSYIDLEAHKSGAGLHHRGGDMKSRKPQANSAPVHTLKNSLQANDTPSHTLKTSPSADDSISSTSSYNDEETERLVKTHAQTVNSRACQIESDGSGIMMRQPRSDFFGDPLERSFSMAIADRAGWLVGLLIFQSLSSFILARNESLLRHHAVIVQFLTMLVGAGGNAGNQASVGVVRGIAVGTIDRSNVRRFLGREFAMGLALSIILGMAGFVRAAVFAIPWLETLAITSSLCMIVLISVVTGALLPLGMYLVGIDPAHASTTIQVIMDITGVVITVHVSSLVLDADFRQWLESITLVNGDTR
jgi:cation transporter-like permease